MPVITAGRSGATWGLNTETGIIAQHSSCITSIQENTSENEDGEIEMSSFYNPTQAIRVMGISLGSGIAGALVGFSTILANSFNGNGVNSGGIYVKEVEQVRENTGFISVVLNTVRRPLVP